MTLLLRSVRHHSTKKSASSNKWINRQINDHYTKSAKFEEYKSRAAYKLLQIDKKFKLFKPGQSVVDLGFAPGAWTQVAVKQTSPNGRVLGVDIIPTMPPKGASALQANILSRKTHVLIQKFFFDLDQSKVKRKVEADTSYLDMELSDNAEPDIEDDDKFERNLNDQHKLPVDLILSDMYGLVFPAERFWNNTTNAAYNRMLNTSGVAVKDHIGSIVSFLYFFLEHRIKY